MIRRFLFICLCATCAVGFLASCADDKGGGAGRTVNLSFLYDGDTIYLPSDESVNLIACYGRGTAEYQSVVRWESSNIGVFSVKAGQRYMSGDSCLSLATLSPQSKEGAAKVIFTVTTASEGSRTVSLNVINTGIKATHLEGMPEGSFAEVVNKIKFYMAYVEADTVIDVGPRLSVKEEVPSFLHDTTGRNFSAEIYEKLINTYIAPYYRENVKMVSFYIGQTPVTAELWKSVMGKDPMEGRSNEMQRPVRNIEWQECMEFVEKLRQLTGKPYRLLTNAEWEYAARGGNQSRGYLYAGSNQFADVGWNLNGYNRYGYTAYDVAQKKPNELGLYDMSGNVAEWVQDVWEDSVTVEVYNKDTVSTYVELAGGLVVRYDSIYYTDTVKVKDAVVYRKARGNNAIIRSYLGTYLLISERQQGAASGHYYIPDKGTGLGLRLGLSVEEDRRKP